jgi:very-short-patch-repair endonuclease
VRDEATTSPPAPLRDGEGRSGDGAVLHPSPSRRGAGGEVFTRGPNMTRRAQALRNSMTDAERALWQGLRGDRLGVRFRRQLVIDARYIADFCAPQVALIVEVDGSQHADNAGDVIRTSYLEKRGYRVMRFWNHEVLTMTQAVLEAIYAEVLARTSPPAPLRHGEGRSGDGTLLHPSPSRRGAGGEVLAKGDPS